MTIHFLSIFSEHGPLSGLTGERTQSGCFGACSRRRRGIGGGFRPTSCITWCRGYGRAQGCGTRLGRHSMVIGEWCSVIEHPLGGRSTASFSGRWLRASVDAIETRDFLVVFQGSRCHCQQIALGVPRRGRRDLKTGGSELGRRRGRR
jgi:hypothetical protein